MRAESNAERNQLNMKKRVITAIVMIAVMIPFFIFSNTVAFPILAAFLAAVGIFEMQRCIGSVKHYAVSVPSLVAAAGMPFIVRYANGGAIGYIFFICFALITYTLAVAVFSKHRFTVDTAALSSSTEVYISFGFSALVMLRDLDHGQYIYFLAFIIPWVTDTFAYFCGRAFGKHKLIPDVSPKKTVEGSIGGTACAVVITLLYGFIIGSVADAEPNYLALALVTFVVSLASQCGDLMMSLVKRQFGIKDYGKLFPGHGGVLDRFDSVICVSPFIYFMTELIPALTLFS